MNITNYREERKLPWQPMIRPGDIDLSNNKWNYYEDYSTGKKYKIRRLSNKFVWHDTFWRYPYDPFMDVQLINDIWEVSRQYKINSLGMLSMYAKESSYGRAIHCYDNNNFFNIKVASGQTYPFSTGSYRHIDPQSLEPSNSGYYAYGNTKDSMFSYAQFLQNNPRYEGFDGFYDGRIPSNNSVIDSMMMKAFEYITFLKDAGYFEATTYDYFHVDTDDKTKLAGVIPSVVNRLKQILL